MDTVGAAEGTTVGGGTNLFLTRSLFLALISCEEMRAPWGGTKVARDFFGGRGAKKGAILSAKTAAIPVAGGVGPQRLGEWDTLVQG